MIPGNPERGRDFVYVDDLVPAFEQIASDGPWNDTITLAAGESTPLRRAAELVVAAAGTTCRSRHPGASSPPARTRRMGPTRRRRD